MTFGVIELMNGYPGPEDRISPIQPKRSPLYNGKPELRSQALLNYLLQGSAPLPEVGHLSEKFAVSEMASSQLTLQILRFLIALTGAERVLEIGTFIGVVSLGMAGALPPGRGTVVTIEKGEEFAGIAAANFADDPLGKKIDLRQGDASAVMEDLRGGPPFDLFLDAAKEKYLELFELSTELLSPTGVIVVDDACLAGDAVNEEPTSEKARGVRKLVQHVTSLPDWVTCVVPIDDGVLVACRTRS